jgi:hypothetical protein
MIIYGSNLFSRNWICNHKTFLTKSFLWKCLVQTCFLGNDFATIKIFRPKNFWWKFLFQTCFRGNDFATIKHFRPKTFWWKFLFETCLLGNDFATIKILRPKNCMIIFGSNLFSRNWICNHKTFLTKIFLWKFLVQICFRGNGFATIKNFGQKFFYEKCLVQTVF